MFKASEKQVSSDLPIQSAGEDAFGFVQFADDIVGHVFSDGQPESLIVGLSGVWGSGKTSLLNLIEERLSNFKIKDKPVLLFRYTPWRTKKSDSIVSNFLPLLVEKLDQELAKTSSDKSKFSSGLDHLKDYANALNQMEVGLKPLVKVLTALGLPLVGTIYETVSDVNASLLEEEKLDIEALYVKAYETLAGLQIPVVVLIDDLDRLEPMEIIDVLRLIRSTAQLPYITFFICYDQTNVIEAIENIHKVDGEKFIEKFVQLPISVPIVEQETIAKNLLEGVSHIIELLKEIDREESEKIYDVFKLICDTDVINTPRDVIRVINTSAFRFKLYSQEHPELVVSAAVLQAKYPKAYDWVNKNILSAQNRNKIRLENFKKNKSNELNELLKGSKSDYEAKNSLIDLILSNLNH